MRRTTDSRPHSSGVTAAIRKQPRVVEAFLARQHLYQELASEVAYVLRSQLKKWGIHVSTISHRSKTLDSFLQKALRKGYRYPLKQTTDLAGVRVVYPYRADRPAIQKIIYESFVVKAAVRKYPRSGLGYRADHYLVTLRPDQSARYTNVGHLLCEIQVRTILQDAWAIVDHHLVYKHEREVPKHLRKRLNLLVGLFESADREFDDIRQERHSYLRKLRGRRPTQLLQQPLNLDALTDYLRWKFPDLRTELYDGEIHGLLADLLRSPLADRFPTLKAVDRVVSSRIAVARRAVKRIQEDNDPVMVNSAALAVTISLARGNDTFLRRSRMVKRYPPRLGWEFDHALGFDSPRALQSFFDRTAKESI